MTKRRTWPAVVVAVVALAVVAGASWVLIGGDDEGTTAPSTTTVPETTSTTASTPAPAVASETAGPATYAAACEGRLQASTASSVEDIDLVEVSGLAIDPSGVAWVHIDSGDAPRIYGVRPDGSVQMVTVEGADAVDWEDIALQLTADGPFLWIADTGGNTFERDVVQMYRVPVPGPTDTSVQASRLDVTYRDGPHDVEAVLVEPEGTLVLLTKEPGKAGVYRVTPQPSGRANADWVGEFPVGNGTDSVLTAADLTTDGSTVVLRTYGAVFVVPVEPGHSLTEALRERDKRCRAVRPLEIQGEAVAFLPDGSGYVTMGEGQRPFLTTVTAGG